MAKTTTYRTLVWIIVILLATNLSMGITFLYHKQHDKKAAQRTAAHKVFQGTVKPGARTG